MAELLRDLKARRTAQGQGKIDLVKWISDLEAFIAQIELWLQPLSSEGLLEVTPGKLKVYEVDHGEYEAPSISMTFPGSGRYVSVEPRGLEIVGAVLAPGITVSGMRGRVDMVSASNEKIVIFHDPASKWVFVGDLPGRSGTRHPVDEDTFALALKWPLP
jgi:hypothetical protein